MRLIDADALRKPIYAEDDNITGIGMTYDEMDAYNCGIKETWKIVEEAPTVEPASPWHRVEEPPKEDGWYMLGFLSRWKNGSWWFPEFPDYWMTAEPPKEDA